MKINSTSATRSVGRSSKAKGVSKGGFAPDTAQAQVRAQGIAATSPIASVEALIALQAADGVEEKRRRARKRATSILDILDTIRMGLIEGGIPQASLERLLNALGERREQTQDPALEAILEQVEIRAQVELAKMQVSLGQNTTTI